jgi:ABC-type antimicrobial peptide transport system permease subunit
LLGIIALVLSVAGLFGVLTYNVNQRTREIGIRMALGASAAAVVRLVMHQSARLAVMGAVVGLVAAFGVMRAMNAAVQFAEVSLLDSVAFALAPVLVLAAAALAALQPARRATSVHPAITLRVDG